MSTRHSTISRRELLTRGLGAGLGLAGGALLLPGCSPGGDPHLPPPPTVAPCTRPATVAAARGEDLAAMTRQALQLLGGIGTVVQPGDRVFLKPNLLAVGLGGENPFLTGQCTKAEVVVAVAEACLEAGAAEVIIGDGAQVAEYGWEEVVTLDGVTHLAAEAARLNRQHQGRVRLVCLNGQSPGFDRVRSRRTDLDGIFVSQWVTRADRVISLPVLKSHRVTQVSFSLKNFVGTTPLAHYRGGSEVPARLDLHGARGGVEGVFLDIFEEVRPDLTIIDASIGAEGLGPWVRPGEGRTVDLRQRLGSFLVLGSRDAVAADATAARVIGLDPLEVRHLRHAHQQGLGQARLERITLLGATLNQLRVEWEQAPVDS